MQNVNSNQENVQILNRIRLIAINGQIALILFATFYLDILLPLTALFSLLVFEILFQLVSWHRVKIGAEISSKELLAHLIFDSLILAFLVYFSGGANNPFIYLLLMPIALGTIMLSPRSLVIVAVLELVLYSLLNIYQRPLELGETSPLASFHLHLMGMWVNFALTVVLMAVFGFLARQSLLKKEKKIQQLREKQMKDEQVLSLGIMSASAAHELGTPLSTMAIIVDDLKHESVPESMEDDFNLLADQIDGCRKIISALNERSTHIRQQLAKAKEFSEPATQNTLGEQLKDTFENWLVYRPQVVLEQKWDEQLENLSVNIPISVEQAVVNLLDNAADAGLENGSDIVKVQLTQNEESIQIDIIDNGKGLSKTQELSLGQTIQETTKKDGLGWGLFLSNASIERVGGSVQLLSLEQNKNKESIGTKTSITLPIKSL